MKRSGKANQAASRSLPPNSVTFQNSEDQLLRRVEDAIAERKQIGLEGLVGDLECVIINTEPEHQQQAVKELIDFTGLKCTACFEDERYRTCVLSVPGSADFLVRSRFGNGNPFAAANAFPKARHLPNTRVETLVFHTSDIQEYVSIQKSRGITFLSPEIALTDNFSFAQTTPSLYTGNSVGVIQWHGLKGDYASSDSRPLDWTFPKPTRAYLSNIRHLDHLATRLTSQQRDDAIIEFMGLTNYNFSFAIYVKSLNSITNVTRLTGATYAMVFTCGIGPYIDDERSGPTEKFTHYYGPRVHHMAFHTEDIENAVACLKADGVAFLSELIGSPEEGLRQIFTQPSNHTLLVSEYIHRYGHFDGFFTKTNVTLLTKATEKQ
jgi:hypothetical protein